MNDSFQTPKENKKKLRYYGNKDTQNPRWNEVDILCDNSDNDLRVCDKCLCGMKRVF